MVKPAILYADEVTLHSPVASMVQGVRQLETVTDPMEQMLAALSICQAVPHFADQLNLDATTLEQLTVFMQLDPQLVRALGAATGSTNQLDELYEHLSGLNDIWTREVPDAVASAIAVAGGEELFAALDAHAIRLVDIVPTSANDAVAEVLRAATGGPTTTDELVTAFVERVLDVMRARRGFPMLDAEASGLVRAFDALGVVSPSAVDRSTEITAAAHLMGFLPAFPHLPIDEVLGLRDEIKGPVVRFRGEVATIAKAFESRAIDEDFDIEVEDAWRMTVAPALEDIREALAEHGLLKEAASVVSGDFRKLLIEAGGVFVAAHGPVVNISSIVAALAAASLPTADVAMKAARGSRHAKQAARRSAFYFLHYLDHESTKRTS